MVAKITTPNSINRALNYNEKKVQKGSAECIHAGNFLLEAKDMNFYDKLDRFKSLNELNGRAKTNTLHISLNFDPSEKLVQKKLIEIATAYMQKIGFGNQPYLVYQHHDAGHPHLHIVTNSIQENGKRINTYNIGRNASENARKDIEDDYGLMKAKAKISEQTNSTESIHPQKIKYGIAETKRSITNVLDAVISKYKYTSLAELNSVLKQYNVMADRGSVDGRIYKYHGLNYRVLDENGNKVGVPIKASSIYCKPTLNILEKRLIHNEELREPFMQKIKTAINWTISKRPASLSDFISQLKKEKVDTVLRKNEQGFIYGITFIDYRSKCVFNGSDLGKSYSAASIQERLRKGSTLEKDTAPGLLKPSQNKNEKEAKRDFHQHDKGKSGDTSLNNSDLLEQLLKTERTEARLPYELRKKKKKKRGFNL